MRKERRIDKECPFCGYNRFYECVTFDAKTLCGRYEFDCPSCNVGGNHCIVVDKEKDKRKLKFEIEMKQEELARLEKKENENLDKRHQQKGD